MAFQSHLDASSFYIPTLLNLDAAHAAPLRIFSWKKQRAQDPTSDAGTCEQEVQQRMGKLLSNVRAKHIHCAMRKLGSARGRVEQGRRAGGDC